MNSLKRQYNAQLEHLTKAEAYMAAAPPEEYRRWQPRFLAIMVECSSLLEQIGKHEEITQDQAINGFKIKEEGE